MAATTCCKPGLLPINVGQKPSSRRSVEDLPNDAVWQHPRPAELSRKTVRGIRRSCCSHLAKLRLKVYEQGHTAVCATTIIMGQKIFRPKITRRRSVAAPDTGRRPRKTVRGIHRDQLFSFGQTAVEGLRTREYSCLRDQALISWPVAKGRALFAHDHDHRLQRRQALCPRSNLTPCSP